MRFSWMAGTGLVLAAGAAAIVVADPNWIVAATADYDDDGKTDVLWRHRISGANELWSEANVKFRKVLTPVTNTAWQVMPR